MSKKCTFTIISYLATEFIPFYYIRLLPCFTLFNYFPVSLCLTTVPLVISYFVNYFPFGACVRLTQFQEMIAEQTDIRSQDQQLLFENHEFNETIKAIDTVAQYPPTSPQNPIYLFCNAQQVMVDVSQQGARICNILLLFIIRVLLN